MRLVAALYVDPRGPYPRMDGVDAWDEARDARRYAGPHPVVVHPPCGPWGTMSQFCGRPQDRDLALLAVDQVRRCNGVLEHPRNSRLWPVAGLPLPGHRGRRNHVAVRLAQGHVDGAESADSGVVRRVASDAGEVDRRVD